MKILHVVPTISRPPIWWPDLLCACSGRALAASGHDVDVFTTSVDGYRDSDVQYGQPVNLDGVQVHEFRSGRSGGFIIRTILRKR